MPRSDLFLPGLMALNLLWFAAGAIYFGINASSAAKLLVARNDRGHPLFKTLSASIRFLGGLNFAFAALAGLILFTPTLFPEARQVAALTAILALAHGTQFAGNLPAVMREGQAKTELWPVLHGRMRFIFCIDILLMLANTGMVVLLVDH